MSRFFISITIFGAIMTASPAWAQDSGVYGTVGLKTIEFDTYSWEGRLGYNLNDFLSVEGEAAVGFIDVEEDGVEIDDNYSLGGYIRAGLPISEQFKLFGRVGYQFSAFSFDGPGVDTDEDFEGLAYGGGIEISLNERSALRIDYTAVDYGDEGGVNLGTADTVSAAYVFKF